MIWHHNNANRGGGHTAPMMFRTSLILLLNEQPRGFLVGPRGFFMPASDAP